MRNSSSKHEIFGLKKKERTDSMGIKDFFTVANLPLLPPFSLLRGFSFQNTSEYFAVRFRQSYLIWKVCDVTAIELSSKE